MEFENEIRMLESRLATLRRENDAKEQKLIDSINALKGEKTTTNSSVGDALAQIGLKPAEKYEGYGSLSRCIRDALARISIPTFDSHDLLIEMEQLSPDVAEQARKSISAIMWKMAGEGLIKQVEAGSGRTPAKYVKTKF